MSRHITSDGKQKKTIIAILLMAAIALASIGVYQVLAVGYSGNAYQNTTDLWIQEVHTNYLDSDQFFVSGVNITDWMAAHTTGGATGSNYSVGPYSYIISQNGTGVLATNTTTGNLDYYAAGYDIASVLASCVHAITDNDAGNQGGSIFIKRSLQPASYTIPGRFAVSIDYNITDTVQISEGVSIYSEGAMLNMSMLNKTALEFYSTTGTSVYSAKHSNIVVHSLGFVGYDSESNTNSSAIIVNCAGKLTELTNIVAYETSMPIQVLGPSYRVLMQNCFLEGAASGHYGTYGVYIDDGASTGNYPNGVTISACDISGFNEGIRVNGGYGVKISNCYFEANNKAISLEGGTTPMIENCFMQTPAAATGQMGIYIHGSNQRLAISNCYLEMNNGDYGVYNDVSSTIATITGTHFYAASSTAGYCIYANATMAGSMSGCRIQCAGVTATYGMYGAFTRFNMGDTMVIGGLKGIYQTGSNTQFDNVKFYNLGTALELTGNNNLVTSCYFDAPATAVTVSGTGNKFSGNFNFTTENSGAQAVTSGTTTASIAHGCSGAPDYVQLSANYNSGAYVTSIDATYIYIAYTNPGATKAIYWTAVYVP